uniref:Uncharacterized protein n=1 Tax=Glossina pallidipes TaxID=7398 RepID=A0A1A9Z7Q4_GLOPL
MQRATPAADSKSKQNKHTETAPLSVNESNVDTRNNFGSLYGTKEICSARANSITNTSAATTKPASGKINQQNSWNDCASGYVSTGGRWEFEWPN